MQTQHITHEAMNKILTIISDPNFDPILAPQTVDQIQAIEDRCFPKTVSIISMYID